MDVEPRPERLSGVSNRLAPGGPGTQRVTPGPLRRLYQRLVNDFFTAKPLQKRYYWSGRSRRQSPA